MFKRLFTLSLFLVIWGCGLAPTTSDQAKSPPEVTDMAGESTPVGSPLADEIREIPVTANMQTPPPLPEGKVRIAINYFENSSASEELEPLKKGLAEMLITDLSVAPELQLVERSRLNDLLNELELGKSEFIDQSSAAKLGKGLGASYIIVGSYIIQASTLRIDARVIDVESSEIVFSIKEAGKTDDFMAIEQGLAKQLLDGLGARLSPIGQKLIGKSGTRNFSAFQEFALGLEHLDTGSEDAARSALARAIELDPSFQAAQSRLDVLEERLLQLEGNVDDHEQQIAVITGGMAEVLAVAGRQVNNGDRVAQFILGFDLRPHLNPSTTWGAPQGQKPSLRWLNQSADLGYPWAGYWAAMLDYQYNENRDRATARLEKSVRDGSPCQAQYGLGTLAWLEGDLDEAIQWYQKVALFNADKHPVKSVFFARNGNETAVGKGSRATTVSGLPVLERDTWYECDAWVYASMYNLAVLHRARDNNMENFAYWMSKIYEDSRARETPERTNKTMLVNTLRGSFAAKSEFERVNSFDYLKGKPTHVKPESEPPGDFHIVVGSTFADESAAWTAAHALANTYEIVQKTSASWQEDRQQALNWWRRMAELCELNNDGCYPWIQPKIQELSKTGTEMGDSDKEAISRVRSAVDACMLTHSPHSGSEGGASRIRLVFTVSYGPAGVEEVSISGADVLSRPSRRCVNDVVSQAGWPSNDVSISSYFPVYASADRGH